jgi:hypothetical protein
MKSIRVATKISVPGMSLYENRYRDGPKVWLVTNLIEQAKDLPVFDLQVAALHVGECIWGAVHSPYLLVSHMKRTLAVDITKPIILSAEGFIMDGWHRVARALLDGRAYIPAVRFVKTPEYDFLDNP